MREEVTQFEMGFLAILVGIIAGFGAVVFRGMIGAVHNLFFLGHLNFFYDANLHTAPSPWSYGIIFVPVIGAIIVAFLVKNFAPEAKGHGVPEVMEAIYLKDGKIRPIVALVKSIASAISIGTGGSVGREGPIVQIGSAFGSTLGKFLKISPRQCNILIAAGAAGGIAATFNTPIGAVAFGIELMLASITSTTILPVAISTVTATYIGRFFLGTTPSFYVPKLTVLNFHLIALSQLTIFIPFGIIIGLCSVVFIKGLYWFEDLFDGMPGNYYTRHMLGMFLMGILIFVMLKFSGHYYVQGVGYATIVDVLKGILHHPWFLLLLVVAKLLATFLTLGSGASGGIFSPSLFLGATLGAALGYLLKNLFPALDINPLFFAMAGMAGMVGGTTGAVLTGAIMVIEMTQIRDAVLPIIITVTMAYAVRKMISNESVYTLKLLRRGSIVPEGLQSAVALAQKASHVMNDHFRTVNHDNLAKNIGKYIDEAPPRKITIVTEKNKPIGILHRNIDKNDVPKNLNLLSELFINKKFVVFPENTALPEIMREMKNTGSRCALVTKLQNTSEIVGVITEAEILQASLEAVNLV